MQRNSRLTRTSEQKSKKQIVTFGIATLVFIIVLFKFGPSLMSGISSLPFFKKQAASEVVVDKNTLEAPFINSIPEATDSATIIVSGTSAYSDAEINLYLNGDLYDTSPLSSDQKFSFEHVRLRQGANTIKAQVKKGEVESDFTREYTVSYSQGDAKLDVSSPSDGQEFTRGDQNISVSGTTDPDSDITVNGFKAIVDSSGSFSYYLKLNEGDNTITIDATNQAGKKTEKTLKVKYKP